MNNRNRVAIYTKHPFLGFFVICLQPPQVIFKFFSFFCQILLTRREI